MQQKKLMGQLGKTHNDLGLLQDTLVMPTGARLPGLFKDPSRRAKLEWFRLKSRLRDFASVIVYKWAIVKGKKPRPKIEFGKMKTVAKRLHHEMYAAFAEGDKAALSKICTQGLLESFTTKINGRGTQDKYEWTAERYIGQPKVVSHRVAAMAKPMPNESSLRQAVVRIRSRQVLEKVNRRGKKEEVSAKDMDEYLVIQKIMVEGRESDWMIWGTTSETDPSTLLDED